MISRFCRNSVRTTEDWEHGWLCIADRLKTVVGIGGKKKQGAFPPPCRSHPIQRFVRVFPEAERDVNRPWAECALPKLRLLMHAPFYERNYNAGMTMCHVLSSRSAL